MSREWKYRPIFLPPLKGTQRQFPDMSNFAQLGISQLCRWSSGFLPSFCFELGASCRFTERFFSQSIFPETIAIFPDWSNFAQLGGGRVSCRAAGFVRAASQLPQWGEAEYLSPHFSQHTDFMLLPDFGKNQIKVHECNVFSHNISSLIPTLLRTFPKSAQLEYQELWFGPACPPACLPACHPHARPLHLVQQ